MRKPTFKELNSQIWYFRLLYFTPTLVFILIECIALKFGTQLGVSGLDMRYIRTMELGGTIVFMSYGMGVRKKVMPGHFSRLNKFIWGKSAYRYGLIMIIIGFAVLLYGLFGLVGIT